MIKAVCFDLHETLAHYQPSREELYAAACHELGFEVSPEALHKSLPRADAWWREENSRSPISKRPPKEKIAAYSEYGLISLRGAGLEVSHDIALQILTKIFQDGLKFELYDDALPTLKLLKKRNLILGIISNVGQDTASTCQNLGLQPYLDFQVTSFEVGCDKPRPGIFLAALAKAQVNAEEAIYVGDQYDLDIVGARGVGMKAVLIDRNDSFPEFTDCPRIHSLTEIVEYL
jgi:putative hydrolase of the HAD superfamily